MVGSAFTVALVGLGALGNAMPAPTRTLKERQVIVGGGDGTFTWGTNVPTSTCVADIPIDQQPPCIPVIIGGGINPSGKRSLKDRQTLIIGDGDSDFGTGTVGPCLVDVPLNEQPPCIPAIIGGGINPSGKRSLKERQTFTIGDGGSSFGWGSGGVPTEPCLVDVPLNEQPPCIPIVVGGGLDPGKHKRFTLPQGWNTDINKAIDSLEIRLEKLQNKKHKSKQDREEIDDIRAALKYLVGIVEISAPPGTTTVFHPGKRSELGTLGDYRDQCPDLEGAELALEHLMHKDHPTPHEYLIMRKLKSFLYGCGITIIKSPDGTTTIIKPSEKRDLALALPANPTHAFDLAGLEIAFEKLVQSVGNGRPSFATWLAIQHLAATLELYGIKIEKTPAGTTTIIVPSTKRQTFTVGNQTCQLADMIGLRAALAALIAAYGPPSKAPANIFLIEQVIVSTLNLCGQDVAGWTTITPGNPVPGGAIVPDPTQTGAPIVADPVETGAPLEPSDKKRDGPVIVDSAALLEALKILEKQYGGYGSGTIPAPVFLIMANIVTVLQADGVVCEGWPQLSGGSIEPST